MTGVDDDGTFHRKSLNTTDYMVATEKVRRMELGEPARADVPRQITLEDAFDRYHAILRTQYGIGESTLSSGSKIQTKRTVLVLAEQCGIRFLSQVDQDFLDKWATILDLSDSTRRTRITELKRFFRVATERKWISENPSLLLKRPPAKRGIGKTEPFDLETEEPMIVAAIPDWKKGVQQDRRANSSIWYRRPSAAIGVLYVMRYTGLRISDALTFDTALIKERIHRGRSVNCYILPKQKKTDAPAFIPLQPLVAQAIVSAERISEKYAFWDESEIRSWCIRFHNRVLKPLERVSGVKSIHAHRFRDTFAVDLLSKGADIRSVSRLLGHRSVSTTIDYYEHYVKADQERLLDTAMLGWIKDSGGEHEPDA